MVMKSFSHSSLTLLMMLFMGEFLFLTMEQATTFLLKLVNGLKIMVFAPIISFKYLPADSAHLTKGVLRAHKHIGYILIINNI